MGISYSPIIQIMIDLQNLIERGVPTELAEQYLAIWNRGDGCKTEAERLVFREVRQLLDDSHDYTQYPECEYLKVGASKHRARICGQAFRGFNQFIPGHDPENQAMDELTERLTREAEVRDFGYELPRFC